MPEAAVRNAMTFRCDRRGRSIRAHTERRLGYVHDVNRLGKASYMPSRFRYLRDETDSSGAVFSKRLIDDRTVAGIEVLACFS